jgi:hypothetical protein
VSLPAVIVLAHAQPAHVRRLLAALAPMPVFLHVDAATDDDVAKAMVAGRAETVRLLPRLRTGWASYGLAEAELSGYRAALAETDAEHLVLCTGADYPLASARQIAATLDTFAGLSWMELHALPIRDWGPLGGYDRFLWRNRVRERSREWSPVPRPWPKGLRPSGGSQLKILARHHAERLLSLLDERPELVSYFREVWIPDETMVPSVLRARFSGLDLSTELVTGPSAWFIDWGSTPSPSPRWLGPEDLPALAEARRRSTPALFARKFDESSSDVLDEIDAGLRAL